MEKEEEEKKNIECVCVFHKTNEIHLDLNDFLELSLWD